MAELRAEIDLLRGQLALAQHGAPARSEGAAVETWENGRVAAFPTPKQAPAKQAS